MKFVTAIAFTILSTAALAADLPDPRRTPGATNPDVTQANIATTICVPGFSKTIRPEPAYTNRLKHEQLRQGLGGGDQDSRHFEEDHLIPLSLGGHPTDPKNLWPEPWEGEWGAKTKDRLELRLHKLICSRQVTLTEAQRAIATNWIEAFKRFCRIESECPAFAGD